MMAILRAQRDGEERDNLLCKALIADIKKFGGKGLSLVRQVTYTGNIDDK